MSRNIQQIIQSINEALLSTVHLMQANGITAVTSILDQNWRLVRSMEDALYRVPRMLSTAFPDVPLADKFMDCGWVPCFDYLPEAMRNELRANIPELDEASLDNILFTHYTENWHDIKSKLECQISGYEVDDEAKQTMLEALQGYEYGLHRLVGAPLFAAIERVLRIANDRLSGRFNVGKSMEEALETWPIEVLPDRRALGSTAEMLSNTVYKSYKSDEELSQLPDHIPNRHATDHGASVYSSKKTSINTILLADYIFVLVTNAVQYSRELTSDSSAEQ